MATCVQKSDIIYEWAARQFAGEATGQGTYWSADPPSCPSDCLAEHNAPYEHIKGSILIRERYGSGDKRGEKVGCEELWSCAVFELYNISYSKDFLELHDSALAGKVPRQDYIFRFARIEFNAVQKTAEFYRTIWQPWAESKGKDTESLHWYADAPKSYEEWIKEYHDPTGYPYSYYGKYYDDEIAPYVKSQLHNP
jgi:hypothetical protein